MYFFLNFFDSIQWDSISFLLEEIGEVLGQNVLNYHESNNQ